jgi:hypothetical protein
MSIAIIIVVPLFLVTLVKTFSLFDRLVRFEYESNRFAWENDGQPYGFFWQAKESTFIRGCKARGSMFRSLLFKTPYWISGNEIYQSLLQRFRVWGIFSRILGVVILIWFIYQGKLLLVSLQLL